MSTTTPNLGLTKPAPGGDDDAWAPMLNGNADILDTQVQAALDAAAAANANANTRLLAGSVSAFGAGLIDDVNAAAGRATLGAVGLTGNETVAGDKTLSGATAATGGLTIGSSPGGAGSGYVRLPAGLILQWGAVGGGAGNINVTFPVAFPAACLSLSLAHEDADTAGNGIASWMKFSSMTTTGATFVRRFSGGTGWADAGGNVRWIAVGY